MIAIRVRRTSRRAKKRIQSEVVRVCRPFVGILLLPFLSEWCSWSFVVAEGCPRTFGVAASVGMTRRNSAQVWEERKSTFRERVVLSKALSLSSKSSMELRYSCEARSSEVRY